MTCAVRTVMLSLALVVAPVGGALADDRAAFAELKRLVGHWQPADKPSSKLRVAFELTAGDTVLTETWRAPGHGSLTVYHLDGDTLIATHYCPQGNQPRMALSGRDEDGALRLVFRDGTSLDEVGEHYQHLLTLRLDDEGRLVRGEIYAGYGTPGAELPALESTRFTRVPAPPPAAAGAGSADG